MATQSAEDIRRWQSRRLEHTGLFLISINLAWLLDELSSNRLHRVTEKKASPQG